MIQNEGKFKETFRLQTVASLKFIHLFT